MSSSISRTPHKVIDYMQVQQANLSLLFLSLTSHSIPATPAKMSHDYKFEGWLGKDKESAKGNMVWGEFPHVKPFEETDVDIQITHWCVV